MHIMTGGMQSVLILLSDCSLSAAPCLPGGRPAVAVAKPGSHPGCAGRSLMCDCSPARCLRSLMCDCSPNLPHPSRPAPGCWRLARGRAFRAALARSSAPGAFGCGDCGLLWDCGLLGDCYCFLFFCLFDCILLLLLVAVVRVGFFYEKSIRTLPMRWRSAKPHKRDCFLRARLYANVSRERG